MLRGVEAVIDKDLGAALLARTVAADVLVVATDVPNAVLRYGTPRPSRSARSPSSRMREHLAEGHFASRLHGTRRSRPPAGSSTRAAALAAITELSRIRDAVAGEAGTVVVPD